MSDIVLFPATYAGTDLQDIAEGGMVRMAIGLVRGLDDGPEVRGVDTVVPGSAGRIPRSRVWDHRTIELEGFVGGAGASEAVQRADMRSMLEALRTLFDPTRAPASLVIGLEDGGTATISARPLNMLCPATIASVRERVNIELEAVEDDWEVVPGG